MFRAKSITCCTNKIVASFSSNASEDHESLGADHEQTLET
jgi:hypothetical protein